MQDILQAFENYLSGLDWVFIFTFMCLARMVTNDNAATIFPFFIRGLLLRIKKVWRVLLLGLLYGWLLYYLRGYTTRAQIEGLFNSLVFAMVFYPLIGEFLFTRFKNFIIPVK